MKNNNHDYTDTNSIKHKSINNRTDNRINKIEIVNLNNKDYNKNSNGNHNSNINHSTNNDKINDNKTNEFYTFNGYIRRDKNLITASMEDYIEMIYRLSKDKGFTRVNELSQCLNVQPPSTTKMVKKLNEFNLATYEKYGVITLTELGKTCGEFLLNRHNLIEEFLKFLDVKKDVLEEIERIEHVVNDDTLLSLEIFMNYINVNSNIKSEFIKYKSEFIKYNNE